MSNTKTSEEKKPLPVLPKCEKCERTALSTKPCQYPESCGMADLDK